MKWRRSSTSQVQDRRGAGGGFGGAFPGGLGGSLGRGGGIPIPVGGGLGGIVLLVIVLAISSGVFGGSGIGGIGGLGGGGDVGTVSSLDPGDDTAQFVNAVTVDVQTFWDDLFRKAGRDYSETTLILFDGSTSSACGTASQATGPFYCPNDMGVYLDAGFFDELRDRFGAPGDFAQAYVIAHEFGHHVQDEFGILGEVDRQMAADHAGANELSIRLELQADCLAGVWAHHVFADPDTNDVESITEADVTEALGAAAAVGDDRIQEQATGRVDRESWTHGSSDQRVRWFRTGFATGTTDGCDTFAASSL